MKKIVIYWLLAIIITLSAVVYQRMTGPTYPKRLKLAIGEVTYKFKLPRSEDKNALIRIPINDTNYKGTLVYRRFPSKEEWVSVPMKAEGVEMTASLPQQPPAGKLEYYITLQKGEEIIEIQKQKPIVIRFKGTVPVYVLLPHVLFMFVSMLLSNLAGILAFAKNEKQKIYGLITFVGILIGGMMLGPLVQKFAFGEYWTGVPFGWDLTDNKTLIGFVGWLVAIAANWKKQRPVYTIIASILMLIIFSIPHSMFGSELDVNTGKVTQGFIPFISIFF